MENLVSKGGAYVYIETITSMISGYVFWFIMAKITTSEIIGISSALISFAVIFTSVVTLGIPSGIQRFLGKSFSEKKIEDAQVYIKAALFLISLGIVVSSTIILIVQDWAYDNFKINFALMLIAILLIASSAMNTLLRSIIVSTFNTKILPLVMIVSSTVKLSISIILVLIGTGALGLSIGYTMNQILASILLGISVMLILKSSKKKSELTFKNSSKKILIASAASWLPALITTIGSQLGTIIVFGAHGANQAGVFFIAFSVFSAVTGIMFSLFTTAYPVLSAMHDGRKKLTWRITKISLITTLPFSAWLIFYSENIMQLFGQSYVEGSSTLGLLLSSILPIAVLTGISTLVYSYGNYRQVLAIGLASSIPRTIFYFIFVPIYGGFGAGIGYTLGSITGFIVSIIIARKIGMQIIAKDLLLLLIPTTALSFLFSYFEVNYIVALLIIPIITWLSLLKLGIITRHDLHDSITILPTNIANPALNIIDIIGKKLNHSY